MEHGKQIDRGEERWLFSKRKVKTFFTKAGPSLKQTALATWLREDAVEMRIGTALLGHEEGGGGVRY